MITSNGRAYNTKLIDFSQNWYIENAGEITSLFYQDVVLPEIFIGYMWKFGTDNNMNFINVQYHAKTQRYEFLFVNKDVK